MCPMASALKSLEVTQMKFSMPALTRRGTSLLLHPLMAWLESIMCLQEHAQLSYRDTLVKSVKLPSILKATRSSRPPATRPAECGPQRQVTRFNVLAPIQVRLTRMRFSLASSITMEIQSSLAQKITLAASGKTPLSLMVSQRRSSLLQLQPKHKPTSESGT